MPSTKNHNRELFRAKAHWIADIFPDELVIQEKTISVVRNEFLVSYVETMPVKDIGRVVYVNTPVFGGSDLSDPNNVLIGSGKFVRHIKIFSPEDIDKKTLTSFIKQANGK